MFSVTLDNTFANVVTVDMLREQLVVKGVLVYNGDLFRMRCCEHILNLVVQEGLKQIDDSIFKIRDKMFNKRVSRVVSTHQYIGHVWLLYFDMINKQIVFVLVVSTEGVNMTQTRPVNTNCHPYKGSSFASLSILSIFI